MTATKRTASLALLVLASAAAIAGLVLPRRATPPPPAVMPDEQVLRATPLAQAVAAPVLGCSEVRIVAREVRARLADEVHQLDDELFAELFVGWLDPHGLWSASPDAVTGAYIYAHARALREEVESDKGSCTTARALATQLEGWVTELGALYDAARASAPSRAATEAFELAAGPIFEDDPVTVPARELARELGRRTGIFELAFPVLSPAVGDQARERYFPAQTPTAWERAVLKAALRAYVSAVDPHGRWVPHDEETSLYIDDPSFEGEPRLWGDMMRTALGVRIVYEPAAPLEVDDLVLGVDGTLTAGLSVERVQQLGLGPLEAAVPVKHVLVLRQGERRAETIAIDFHDKDEPQPPLLAARAVPYGSSHALHVRIDDVPEDLGGELSNLVAEIERSAQPAGMLLDLRGNGGGSTTGACGAVGVFLPGAPVFPLLYRGRTTEVLSAMTPARAGRFAGPVAVLVDSNTASAAEMIAGALDRYDRGAVLGSRTFGKGCVQEYFDDAAGTGVLRLTTLLFALPDGTPVQRLGLEPRFRLDLDSGAEKPTREADLDGAISPRVGPDVREAPWRGGPAWPDHRGRVGPCEDPAVCAALRRVGASPSVARLDVAQSRRSPSARAEKKP